MNRTLGAALLVAGAILLFFGFQASQSVGSEISNFFTGQPTDKAIWFLLGGAAAAVGGIVLLVIPSRQLAR